jgi:hypothetical protein
VKTVDYAAFVRKTSQFAHKPKSEQRSIAIYGVVGEIGSLLAAVKKKYLVRAARQMIGINPMTRLKRNLAIPCGIATPYGLHPVSQTPS